MTPLRNMHHQGHPAWRHNNPGNVKLSPITKEGAIGKSKEGFAIFPDYETGRKAQAKLLKTVYYNSTIYDAIKKYAPPGDRNDSAQYRKNLQKITGLDITRKIKDLNEADFKKLLDGMQRVEGYKVGEEESFKAKSIIDIKTDKKKVIVAYLIEDLGWKTKAQTIKLIEDGRVDAVIVRESSSIYIRTRPDGVIPNNLEEKKAK
jgi:hypothetical protein